MKNILLFGAGKSATVLIHYLLNNAGKEGWHLTVVDADLELAKSKVSGSNFGTALSFNIEEEAARRKQISQADIVISLLPPALHFLVAKDCLECNKNLLTASYVDDALRGLEKEIAAKDLLFLCEAGLDPGIDHMSAKKMLDEIKEEGGIITSFISHCGGLVADESDDNPWHYKISWNPRNVVMAGKNGAIYKLENDMIYKEYEQLFSERNFVMVPGYQQMMWYPNRDSLPYSSIYQLEHCKTFIRTTLRHPDFINGWKNIIDLKLTDEEKVYQTDGKTLMLFFKEHLERHHLEDWLQQQTYKKLDETKRLLEDLVKLVELEELSLDKEGKHPEDLMVIDKKGDLKSVDIDQLKTEASATVANQMHEANLTVKQLFFLGMMDDETVINKGLCSAADVLQFALEKKLSLTESDKDLVVMMHEMEYEKGSQKWRRTSTLLVKGENNKETAMAKTVGLPLGICAKLVLNAIIKTKGLQIPVLKEIYEPVLEELAQHGILFQEELEELF